MGLIEAQMCSMLKYLFQSCYLYLQLLTEILIAVPTISFMVWKEVSLKCMTCKYFIAIWALSFHFEIRSLMTPNPSFFVQLWILLMMFPVGNFYLSLEHHCFFPLKHILVLFLWLVHSTQHYSLKLGRFTLAYRFSGMSPWSTLCPTPHCGSDVKGEAADLTGARSTAQGGAQDKCISS